MVVSGALTASGAPDPARRPADRHDAAELLLPGRASTAAATTRAASPFRAAPGIVIGRTPNAAWTITSGITDNTDIYIEPLNPSNPKQYVYRGGFRDMSCRTETFNPAGQPAETHEFCRTVHGPVIASYPVRGRRLLAAALLLRP